MIRQDGFITKLIYEDNFEFYEIQEWLNNYTLGKVKIRAGWGDQTTIVHVVYFEKEDDALFCKLKYPTYKV